MSMEGPATELAVADGDVAGHANVGITTGYLHVAVDNEAGVGICSAVDSSRYDAQPA
jgi:hypothetical protein